MFRLCKTPGILRLWLPVALPLAAAAQTIPPGYELVDITRDNGRNEELARINNRGQVVFSSRVVGSLTDSEIWLYESVSNTLTQITDDDVYDIGPDINDEGTIVWCRSLGPWDPQLGIFTFEIMMRTPDGTVTRITSNEAHENSPRINNLGKVVWKRYGSVVCGGWTKDILMYDTGKIIPITTNGLAESLENQGAVINDLGQIIWTEYDFCDPPPPYNFTSRIMLYQDAVTRPLPVLSVTPQVPQINEQGEAVWMGSDPVFRRDTVEYWDGVQTVSLTNDGGNPTINNFGDIVFNRWHPSPRVWQLWMHRDGRFIRLTDDLLHNIGASLNDGLDLTWSFGSALLDLDIRLLRRFEAGDLNCDGSIDAFDIEAFIVAMLDPAGYPGMYPGCDPVLADVNGDRSVDSLDIEPFIRLLVP